MQSSILDLFPSAEDAVITVSAASVNVEVQLIMLNVSAAVGAFAAVESLSSSTTTLSEHLSVTVESFTALPSLGMLTIHSPSPPPSPAKAPASPPGSTTSPNSSPQGALPPAGYWPPPPASPGSIVPYEDAAVLGATTHTALSTLHIWLPIAVFGTFLCMLWCWCYTRHVDKTDKVLKDQVEAFDKKIQYAVDTGKIVRASDLATPREVQMDMQMDAAQPSSEERGAKRSSEDEVSPRSEGSEEPKEVWSLLTATKARLKLDQRASTEKRIRMRVERARQINRIVGRRAAGLSNGPPNHGCSNVASNAANVAGNVAPTVPAWLTGSPYKGCSNVASNVANAASNVAPAVPAWLTGGSPYKGLEDTSNIPGSPVSPVVPSWDADVPSWDVPSWDDAADMDLDENDSENNPAVLQI